MSRLGSVSFSPSRTQKSQTEGKCTEYTQVKIADVAFMNESRLAQTRPEPAPAHVFMPRKKMRLHSLKMSFSFTACNLQVFVRFPVISWIPIKRKAISARDMLLMKRLRYLIARDGPWRLKWAQKPSPIRQSMPSQVKIWTPIAFFPW